MEKTALLFAGQGAQYVGMGRDLYETFAESKAVFDQADKILGFPLSRLCFFGPQEELTATHNCQAAILTTSIAAWEAYKAASGCRYTDFSFAAGLSLGEYSALVAAGALNFADAVYLVRRRGEFMEEEANKIPGRMLSLIGLDLNSVSEICAQSRAEVANINCPGQVVISGGLKETEQAWKLAEERGAKKVVALEVSGAFHSSLMKGACLKLSRELEKIKVNTPSIAVVSNVTGRPVTSPDEIKENLVRQIAASVLWEGSMEFILSQGVKKFLEFGPGRVLKGLMRRIDSSIQVMNVEKREDITGLLGSI